MAQAFTRQKQSDRQSETAPRSEIANAVGPAVARETSNPIPHPGLPHDQVLPSADSQHQPVVRHWQELVGASITSDEQVDEPERWNPRQSVPFLTFLSIALWGLLLIGALKII